ncbi:erythrocyte membrane protein 1, PfEMP1, putative [Plasmodium gaboni]|uniref:Erythrocyte membrane protein 1, PfEMP1, putative n=1 Tax=Plasmodium gaboni TaxID=647221 RepID=A0ABY1UV40_9APIC|nr:erythrocyte membrane protein 1, PfEMP1, putative [Plasmodium gaboni]
MIRWWRGVKIVRIRLRVIKTCTKCKECKEKCTEYNEFISKWKTDWETQSQKYKTLYQQAKSGTGTDENLKYLNTFLEKLRTENSTNDTYKTAAGYVHEELKNMDCVEQKHFCKKNSSTAPGKEDDSYAFREKPHEYVAACSCIKDNTSQKPPLKPDSAKPATTKPDGDSGRGSARSGRNSNSPVINITEPTKDRQGTIAITTTQTNPDPSSEPGGGSGSSSQPGGQAGKDSGNTGGQSSNVDPGSNKSQPAQAPTQEIPCKIVEEILLKPRDSITGGLYNCNHKTEPFNWDCDPVSMNNKNKGACMPPRRQKLCIHNLTKLDPTKNTDELRRAFIKCAALETHFSWNKYKRGNIQAFSQLKKGTIPDNFLRSMKYSFGDYRDIFFGTDITSHSYIAEVSQNVLNILKEEKDKQAVPKIQNDRELLNKWWETYHKDIWDAMVCSLTHGLTDDSTKTKIKTNYPYSDDIETFAKTPQFLRWFTEWGDEFCHERKTQLNLLHGNCSGYECNKEENEDKKTKCEGSCEIYQTFIDKWKKEYETQSKKYIIDKNEEKYKSTSAQDDVEKANNAYQYLNTQFKELCKNGQCKCMEKPSKQSKTSEPNSSANDVIPKSLDYPPEEFKNSCDCKPPEEEEPDSSLNCVDKSAFDLKNVSHEGIKDVEKTLKGKNTKDVYEGKQPSGETNIDNILDTTYIPSDISSGDTPNSVTIPRIPSDIPNHKFTEEEWNQLKQDFILNMLQNDIPDENVSGNICMDPQPDTVDNIVREKPFITSIQDRKLYCDNEITYNIDWNVPENITTNNMDIPKYVTSNDQYTGIDLINDSLNSDQHVDIYEEILKRKENELFGTNNTKNTTFNRVATETYTDPIMNQLNLFHEWLDRHRDMCEKCSNKEEMLSKLSDEWNNENKEHLLDISLNGNDINTINHENYNMINENTQINHEGNDKTSVEHLGSTNIPPNDLTTQNNGSQTNNLRTNVSINIHFDENNNNNNVLTNNVTHEEDHLENMYNF